MLIHTWKRLPTVSLYDDRFLLVSTVSGKPSRQLISYRSNLVHWSTWLKLSYTKENHSKSKCTRNPNLTNFIITHATEPKILCYNYQRQSSSSTSVIHSTLMSAHTTSPLTIIHRLQGESQLKTRIRLGVPKKRRMKKKGKSRSKEMMVLSRVDTKAWCRECRHKWLQRLPRARPPM